jgi:hypothetical protein
VTPAQGLGEVRLQSLRTGEVQAGRRTLGYSQAVMATADSSTGGATKVVKFVGQQLMPGLLGTCTSRD